MNGRKIEEMDAMEEGSPESEEEMQQAFGNTLGVPTTPPTPNNVAFEALSTNIVAFAPTSNIMAFTAPAANSVAVVGPSTLEKLAFTIAPTDGVAFYENIDLEYRGAYCTVGAGYCSTGAQCRGR